MRKISDLITHYSNIFLGVLVASISILILMNVVLRYVFNSGLVWAEELTRFLFVWLVFIGAVLALKENNHLGFTSVVKAMPAHIKKLFFVSSNIMMFIVLILLLGGGFEMIPIGMANHGASTGIPMAAMYAVVIPMSIGMLIIIAFNIYQAFFIQGSIDRLISLKESEEEAEFDNKEK